MQRAWATSDDRDRLALEAIAVALNVPLPDPNRRYRYPGSERLGMPDDVAERVTAADDTTPISDPIAAIQPVDSSPDAISTPRTSQRSRKPAAPSFTRMKWAALHERARGRIPHRERLALEAEVNRRTALSHENAPPLSADDVREMVRRGERFEFDWDVGEWRKTH
jgi:hypothetical protein